MLYSQHMAAKKTTLNELGEMLAHVVKHMATKDDLAAVELKLYDRIDALDGKIDRIETNLSAKIDRLDTKLIKNASSSKSASRRSKSTSASTKRLPPSCRKAFYTGQRFFPSVKSRYRARAVTNFRR